MPTDQKDASIPACYHQLMEPGQPTPQEERKSIWYSVAPLSRYLALGLFVALLFVGGWIEYIYAPEKGVGVEKTVTKSSPRQEQTQKQEVNSPLETEYLNSGRPFISEYECSSYSNDAKELFEKWTQILRDKLPQYNLYGFSMCLLPDDRVLVGLSSLGTDVHHAIVLFDKNQEIIEMTTRFPKYGIGDLATPKLIDVDSNAAMFSFSGGDAGIRLRTYYVIDLSTFDSQNILSFSFEGGAIRSDFSIQAANHSYRGVIMKRETSTGEAVGWSLAVNETTGKSYNLGTTEFEDVYDLETIEDGWPFLTVEIDNVNNETAILKVDRYNASEFVETIFSKEIAI